MHIKITSPPTKIFYNNKNRGGGGGGLPPATINMKFGNFRGKQKEKINRTTRTSFISFLCQVIAYTPQLDILVKALIIFICSFLPDLFFNFQTGLNHTFLFTCILRCFSQVHGELDYFGCHGWHFVTKAVVVCSIHICSKCIFSITFPFSCVNDFLIWTSYLS